MDKNIQKIRRKIRTRRRIMGTKERPRLSVFRSNRFVYAQLINDEIGKTVVGVSEKHLSEKVKLKKIELAKLVGSLLARKAQEKKIKKVVFDKGSYAYQGRVRGVADGAREGGLEF